VYLSTRNILTVSVAQPFFDEDDLLDGVLGIILLFLVCVRELCTYTCSKGVHLSLPRLKDAFSNLTAYLATKVILVAPDGTLILDSCPSNPNGDPITCQGLVSSPSSPFNINSSGGIYGEVADYVSENGGWANVTSGYKVINKR
jgi:hypothetical protein